MEQKETKETKEPKAGKNKEPGFIKQYRECYPENKTFHVTSDGMVFLEREASLAADHQRKLGEGEVTIY